MKIKIKIKILLITTLFISFISYSQNSSQEGEIQKKESNKEVLATVKEETPPLAPKCKAKWNNEKKKKCLSAFINMHVNRNLDTGLAEQTDIKGLIQIEIKFVIDKEGKAVNVTATGGPGIINKDAIRVLNTLPQLEPGTINGEPVSVDYTMKVAFMAQ